MAKSKVYERIEDDSPTYPRIEPAEVAAALGAEPIETSELERLRAFAEEVRAFFQETDDKGHVRWIAELSGADAIEVITSALVTAGFDAEDPDDGERTDCGGCGESWNATESDADDADAYCSSECELNDTEDEDAR